jgi:AgrD protein
LKSRALRLILTLSAAICTFLALTTSASACAVGFYQPEEPKCLNEE